MAMTQPYCSSERNVQIVIALLKAHGIHRVIVSPGSTNIALVGSLQNDSFFTMYSCVDERSAAYMACGMAAESGEPVVLSCTGATASRNYYPGLTEAYYRKLPVLAITSSQDSRRFGHLKDQITDRINHPTDIVNLSVCLQNVRDEEDEWDVMVKCNKAVLELFHHGGGPVHINLETVHNRTFLEQDVRPVRIIRRYFPNDEFPTIPGGRVAIFIGSHLRCSENLVQMIDDFCRKTNAVVFGEPNNGYWGKYRIKDGLLGRQHFKDDILQTDLIIHLGEVACHDGVLDKTSQIWRVSPDGELRDRAHKLSAVFEMSEEEFFAHYAECADIPMTYLKQCVDVQNKVESLIPELPFSNIWLASQLHNQLPAKSVLFLGILAPLRSWSMFSIPKDVTIDCNQGGFGIDGNMSSMIGASLAYPNRLHFAIVGDLSFFYDMNCLGNRQIGNNVRILLVNNGDGCEFQLDSQMGKTLTKEETDAYISAGGHYGNKSHSLVRQYAESLGFEYLSANNKKEFCLNKDKFVSPEILEKSIILEVFTETEDENNALNAMTVIDEHLSISHNSFTDAKKIVKKMLHKLDLV